MQEKNILLFQTSHKTLTYQIYKAGTALVERKYVEFTAKKHSLVFTPYFSDFTVQINGLRPAREEI